MTYIVQELSFGDGDGDGDEIISADCVRHLIDG